MSTIIPCSKVTGCSVGYSGITELRYGETHMEFGATSAYYRVGVIKFTVPFNVVKCTQINVTFGSNTDTGRTGYLRYALCTSDSNYTSYFNTWDVVSDSNQIDIGRFNITYTSESTNQFVIYNTGSVLKGETYYLFIWAGNRQTSSGYLLYQEDTPIDSVVTIEFVCDGYSQSTVNGYTRTPIACTVYHGDRYTYALPYIYLYKTDSWDKLFSITTTTSVILRKLGSYQSLFAIDSGTTLVIEDIQITPDNSFVCLVTSYESYNGWLFSTDVDYLIYARVCNAGGAKVFTGTTTIEDTGITIPYGTEVSIKNGLFISIKYGDTNKAIYATAEFKHNDVVMQGAIMLSDLEIMSERSYYTWELCCPYIYAKSPIFLATSSSDILLYADHDTESNVLSEIPSGVSLQVMEIYGDENCLDPWLKVKHEDVYGWIESWKTTYTATVRVKNPDGAKYYNVNSDIVNCAPMEYGTEFNISTQDLKMRDGTVKIILDYTVEDENGDWIAYIMVDDVEFIF